MKADQGTVDEVQTPSPASVPATPPSVPFDAIAQAFALITFPTPLTAENCGEQLRAFATGFAQLMNERNEYKRRVLEAQAALSGIKP